MWAKARRSREWWLWQTMTGTLSRVEGDSVNEKAFPSLEVDLAGGIFGDTGPLSFVLAPNVTCRGQWFATVDNAAMATRGRLLSQYGPQYFPGSALPAVADTYQRLGRAFIDCDGGRTMRLEFITGPGTPHGWGIAKDNHGAIYRFTF